MSRRERKHLRKQQRKARRRFKKVCSHEHHLTVHHRLCKSNGGGDEESNLSYVPHHLHVSFHNLFSNHSVHGIALILNEKWIEKKYKLIVVER